MKRTQSITTSHQQTWPICRQAMLSTVANLSRQGHICALVKIGAKTMVELPVQCGHLPLTLAACAAATDRGETLATSGSPTLRSYGHGGQAVLAMLSCCAVSMSGNMAVSGNQAVSDKEGAAQLTWHAGWAWLHRAGAELFEIWESRTTRSQPRPA